ncbi:MAG TPA: bacillithiol biosynthesis deacetylase BshB1 [Planctomycetaceae bacterium]|nr:bacillithiol biosynthesis deacetylase BshB1 [Planctomycetaceae bacterium]
MGSHDGLDILVVAPHPDDAELGMGGAIAKMITLGWNVGVLDLTNGEPTPFGSEEIRERETDAATKILGLKWRENLGLPNRFLEPDLQSRAKLANVFRRTRPRWLFAPYWEDAHPDHVAATSLVEAARFWSKLTKSKLEGDPYHPERIFYYYCVHLKHVAQPAFVLDISQHWQQKADAIAAFESQFTTNREHIQPSFHQRVRDEAAYWGKMIGKEYGEPFASREPIALSDFTGLV